MSHPPGSFLFTGALPDSSFNPTFVAAPATGGYHYYHDLPTPPSSPYVAPRAHRMPTISLPPEQSPITLHPFLTCAQAYNLGIDLATSLPQLHPQLLVAPATSPSITELRIVHSSLTGPIFLVPDPAVGYIRVQDVILAIYQAMRHSLVSLPGTKFVGLAHNVAHSNRLLATQDKYQDRTWIIMTHNHFGPVSVSQ